MTCHSVSFHLVSLIWKVSVGIFPRYVRIILWTIRVKGGSKGGLFSTLLIHFYILFQRRRFRVENYSG